MKGTLCAAYSRTRLSIMVRESYRDRVSEREFTLSPPQIYKLAPLLAGGLGRGGGLETNSAGQVIKSLPYTLNAVFSIQYL
jgi:hypothetical protein